MSSITLVLSRYFELLGTNVIHAGDSSEPGDDAQPTCDAGGYEAERRRHVPARDSSRGI